MLPLFTQFVQTAHAAAPDLNPVGSIGQVTHGATTTLINSIYTQLFTILTLVAGLLAVLYLIWYGIQYITSGGSGDKAKTARAGIINAVVGIVVVVAAYTIIRIGVTIGNQINTTSAGTTTVATTKPTGGSGTGTGVTGNPVALRVPITLRSLTNTPLKSAQIYVDGTLVGTTGSDGSATAILTAINNASHTVVIRATENGESLACELTTTLGKTSLVKLQIPKKSTPLTPCLHDSGTTVEVTPDTGTKITRRITATILNEQGNELLPNSSILVDGKKVATTNTAGTALFTLQDVDRNIYHDFTITNASRSETCTFNLKLPDDGDLEVWLAQDSCALTQYKPVTILLY